MDPSLRDVVHGAFGRRVDAAVPMVGMGDECRLWRVTAPERFVVRVAPAFREVAALRWAYSVAATLATAVGEVVTPLSDRIAVWDGQPVTIWPWVPGAQLDRSSATERDAAAALLARLHRTARSAFPPAPALAPAPAPPDDLDDPALDAVVAALPGPAVPVHGDFYRRNLHCVDGRVVGLLDWDEARLDHPVVELAWSVWEFAKVGVGDRMDASRAARFLGVYESAGGPPFPPEVIVPLIRVGLRREIRRGRAAFTADDPAHRAYIEAEERAYLTL